MSWNGAPKRIRSEQSERNSDCYTKCQSRLRQQSTLRVVRIRTAKFVNFAVLLPMSAARDKLKCYALDLSLLAVSNLFKSVDLEDATSGNLVFKTFS